MSSVGDGHAAQGNGEVCVTAIETNLTGVFRFRVHKDLNLRWPRARTPSHIITMGLHGSLDEAARLATKQMIDYLTVERGLSRDDAYMLTSAAADLHVTQVVDGVKGVHAMLPKAVFSDPRWSAADETASKYPMGRAFSPSLAWAQTLRVHPRFACGNTNEGPKARFTES